MASTVIGGSQVSLVSGTGILAPQNTYSTLPKLRKYLSLASADTSDDNQLKDFLKAASRAIDRYCHRKFYPRWVTLQFDLPDKGDLLRIDDDLLEVRGLSDLNGASEIDSNVYWLKAGDHWNKSPYDRVILDTDTSGSLFKFSGTPLRAIHADVILGFHEDYDNAWIDSAASLTSAATATDVEISVSGSVGNDTIGNAPRFEELQIWKIDSEYMIASSGLSTSNVRMVRGINGTTAASHAASTQVYVFSIMEDIEFATRRLAAMEYHQSHAPYTGRTIVPQLGGIVEDQTEWPLDVKGRIDRYRKHRIYAI